MANLVKELRQAGHEVETQRKALKPYLAEDKANPGLGDQLIVWCKTHHEIDCWLVKKEA